MAACEGSAAPRHDRADQSDAIGARLSAVAARLPDKIAICERDMRLSFAQLDAAATAIARRILTATAGGAGVACLFFESKLPALTAIFGAGRSGRAYAPLDAGDPEERLRFIIDDCAPIALLTEPSLVERARSLAPAGCAVIDIDGVQESHGAPALPNVDPDAPLNLIYTSGSTGRPKGVIQTHRGLVFFTDAYARALKIGPADRLSLLYTLSFNAGNTDILAGLLHGATLCAFEARSNGVRQLADWLDRERITVLHTVPTVFREMAGRLPPGRLLPHLRAVALGGESVFANDVELYRSHTMKHCVFVNQLGATESALVAQHIIGHDSPPNTGAIVPIGRCIDGVRVEIRRADGELAGAGEVGEIFICSAHVSPGYWRRPELEAAAFSADPREPGWRRYRGGDQGRVDAAGNLHLLGRTGSRVKVRGHSVDLMEVEAALAACPDVGKAAVLALASDVEADAVRLVAYVTIRDDTVADPQRLRRQLSARLPIYMLPAEFAFVDTLPLTASGKIDRSALERIVPVRAIPKDVGEPPRDEVEAGVARIFAQLLKLDAVGRDDDFFLLGGDSLLGVELQASLMQHFGTHVGNFHENATVAGIAASIRDDRATPGQRIRDFPVLIPLWRNGSEPPLFLVHGRHGQAFVSPHFMRLLGDDQPVWAFQARGLDGLRDPHPTVEDMAAEYLGEMRKRQPHGPYFIGSLCAGAYIAAEMARALRQSGEVVLPLLLLDPPASLTQRGYTQLSEEQFLDKMRKRRAMGGTAGPMDDPAYAKALVRTALAFEGAIAQYRPRPYDGPVYVLSSRQRMQGAGSLDLRQIFTGRLKRYEVGSTHAEALNPHNPVFVELLQRCVGLIREAARAGGAS